MEPDVTQGLLALESSSSKLTNDFDIDAIIKDFIAIGADKVLSDVNFKAVVSKIDKLINSEYAKLNQNLKRIIQDRSNYEQDESNKKYNAQIKQKETDAQNQINRDLTAKAKAVQQDLEKQVKLNAFTSKKHFDNNKYLYRIMHSTWIY